MSVLGLPDRLKDCCLQALVKDEIGVGTYRKVYALDEQRVLKVEFAGYSFSNAHEWTIWKEVEGGKWAKWFAPALHIDDYGAALIMARTAPLTDEQWKALKRVPSFMADVKRENWGWLDGRAVCHDYGNHRCFADSFGTAKITARK